MKKAFTTIMLVGAALLTLPSAHADDEPWFELTPGIGQQICRTVYNAEKQGWPGRDFAVEQWWDPSNPNGLTKKQAEHLVDEAIDTYCQSGEPRPPQARASGEVKGLVQGAAKGQACSNFTRFRFGKGSTGDNLICMPQGDGTGLWVASVPVIGTRPIGSSCKSWANQTAQSPDGRALLCDNGSWVAG